MLLPFDLSEIIHTALRRSNRPPDGLLHPSSHLISSLRHVQLELAGAPTHASHLLNDITLRTGTMWHEYIGAELLKQGIPVLQEVDVTPWLPFGWSGTADLIFWHPQLCKFILVDVKTTRGETMSSVEAAGPKDAHIWQVSAYYWALVRSGMPMHDVVGVYYLPKNGVWGKSVTPLLLDFKPLDEQLVTQQMNQRKDLVDAYLGQFAAEGWQDYVNDKLAPTQKRVQKMFFDKKTNIRELKLVPHWSAAYCDFSDDLCDCNTGGSTKIGHYDAFGMYNPRKGYEDVLPTLDANGNILKPTKVETKETVNV